jgi:hypothetical protein
MADVGTKSYLGSMVDANHPANIAIGIIDRHTLVSAAIAAVTIAIVCSVLASITTGGVSDLMSLASVLAVVGLLICGAVGTVRIWNKLQAKPSSSMY